MTREEMATAWQNYAQGIGVAKNDEEQKEIFLLWSAQNDWWADRYDSEANRQRLLDQMLKSGYKVSLITIQSSVNALFGMGQLKHAEPEPEPVTEPTEAEKHAALVAEVQSDINDPEISIVDIDLKRKDSVQYSKAYNEVRSGQIDAGYGDAKSRSPMFDPSKALPVASSVPDAAIIDPELQNWVNVYNVTSSLSFRHKYNQDKKYAAMYERAIAARLI